MNNEKLLNFIKNHNGYISAKEIENLGISKMQIPNLIEDEIVRKVAHGLYIDNKLIEDEFYILQRRFSNIIFSYNTACYLLNLSDRTPYEIDVTAVKNHKIRANVKVHYVTKDKFDIGITEITSPYGNPIKIYNAERSLCDILKNSNSVDLEVYNKIINNYFKQKQRNLITLERYAEKLGVSEKLKNIMEVLI